MNCIVICAIYLLKILNAKETTTDPMLLWSTTTQTNKAFLALPIASDGISFLIDSPQFKPETKGYT